MWANFYCSGWTLIAQCCSLSTASEFQLQDYAVSMYLRQKWVDRRLAYVNISDEKVLILDSRRGQEIWAPDLFFNNEKSGHFHHITVPNTFIRIYPDGSIAYSTRYAMIASLIALITRLQHMKCLN